MQYIAVERLGFGTHKKFIQYYTLDKASFTPAGWHKPYNYYTLDNIGKAKKHPAQKRPALVHLPSLVVRANQVRILDADTCQAIDDIDNQIKELLKQKSNIIQDNFYTFQLVQEVDLEKSHDKVYSTKQEAEQG